MSWLQKRPSVANPTTFFTTSLNEAILIVGLGNPEKEYDKTRHNIGFACVDAFVNQFEELQNWSLKKDLKCAITSGQLGDKRVMLIKPTTFMNNSGEAVQAVSNFYKIPVNKILVVHDELDIDFGQIRTRVGGSSAGHNGIKSVTKHLGDENYARIRIGIGPKKPASIDSSDFVLQKFNKDETELIGGLEKEVSAILTEFIYGDGNLLSETRSFLI
jgi:peptidyl-tRNA hydrolase, PTH1 family